MRKQYVELAYFSLFSRQITRTLIPYTISKTGRISFDYWGHGRVAFKPERIGQFQLDKKRRFCQTYLLPSAPDYHEKLSRFLINANKFTHLKKPINRVPVESELSMIAQRHESFGFGLLGDGSVNSGGYGFDFEGLQNFAGELLSQYRGVPKGSVLVTRAALSLVRNALMRDKESGLVSRGEILDELDNSTSW